MHTPNAARAHKNAYNSRAPSDPEGVHVAWVLLDFALFDGKSYSSYQRPDRVADLEGEIAVPCAGE